LNSRIKIKQTDLQREERKIKWKEIFL